MTKNTVDGNVSLAFEQAVEILSKNIAKRKQECLTEIENEKKEASKKLTSENMYKEVFNTHAKPNPPTKQKIIETIHSPKTASQGESGAAKGTAASNASSVAESDRIASPVAQAFAELTTLEQSYKYLSQHPEIVNQSTSDEILAEAFRLQMKGGKDAKKAKQFVHQSLLLQYCSLLGKDGVVMFFKRFGVDITLEWKRLATLQSRFSSRILKILTRGLPSESWF